MTTVKEQVAHYCNRYAVFCTGANERGECSTTACWNSRWLSEMLKGCDTECTRDEIYLDDSVEDILVGCPDAESEVKE